MTNQPQPTQDDLHEAIEYWLFTRSETQELLHSLTDEQLLFTPEGPKWQPLYYQFTCMVRVQLAYAKALRTGGMDFAYFADKSLPGKRSLKSRQQLDTAFNRAKGIWQSAITTIGSVKWYDQNVSVAGHIYRLVSHERMHQGQLISYFTLAGYKLPPNFKQIWAL